MNEKYIMILGAGLMQRPSIEAARELGYKTLVVDGNPHAICASFADRFEIVDLKDREGLANLALSLKNEIAAVFTAGTDFSASVSYVAEKCSLPSHSFESAVNASNKIKMRQCFKSCGVSSPDFEEVREENIPEILSKAQNGNFSYPKVIKPVDNMGARGCRMARNYEELLPAIKDAVKFSRSGSAILEDYMEGPEFSIDALLFDGKLTITGFADRHIYFPPYFIETGHTMPTVIDENKKKELILCFAKAIKALGLSHGSCKADIKYTEKGPMIGEVAGRLSGGYMSGWTFPYASDLFLTKQALLIALGKQPEELIKERIPLNVSDSPFELFEYPVDKVSAERAWISIPGVINKVYGLDKAEVQPYVKNVLPRCKDGDSVDFPRNNVEKCGNVISLSSVYGQAVLGSEAAVSTIVLRLNPDNQQTEEFLSGKIRSDEKGFPVSAFDISLEELVNSNEKCIQTPFNGKIPESLTSYADNKKDWNHRTIRQTLEIFDALVPEKMTFDSKDFYNALVRGGIQGILYLADCQKSKKMEK